MKDGFRTIPLDRIEVPERLRAVDEDHALVISTSVAEHGLLNPITVQGTADGYRLLAGAHRLRAVELLDWREVDAFVTSADGEETLLIEIAENLHRNELSALERAIFVMKYRETWERKHGKINAKGGRPKNRVNLTQFLKEHLGSGFKAHVAERLGLSESAIKRAQYIGARLRPELRQALAGTEHADNQSLLKKLAALEPDAQRTVAKSYAAEPDIKAALAHVSGRPREKTDDPLAKLKRHWRHAPTATKRAFLEQLAESGELNDLIGEL
ncbi:ParB/RepB/Spo0J family partition protein [Kaustia mangrovi]|uniref:ParB/RepB/Spo0J family partition protein n=1 Tax=Kaustia mangrovi TaxID=2593653 RepID=A0A7S8C6W0_9HYPH|nr:ParB/RepB/Spo0J family partition protein [Kaustia mangrovi]QPC44486.1 ParB/RepB/Spo0J family partition protein [Kaustia mangrovi]